MGHDDVDPGYLLSFFGDPAHIDVGKWYEPSCRYRRGAIGRHHHTAEEGSREGAEGIGDGKLVGQRSIGDVVVGQSERVDKQVALIETAKHIDGFAWLHLFHSLFSRFAYRRLCSQRARTHFC